MDLVELDVDDAAELTALYEEYGWWADRDEAAVEAALRNTPLALGLRGDGEVAGDGAGDGGSADLVASARVLTDFTFYARIYDVVVRAERRGEGVGRELMRGVVDHPALADVNPVLVCREGLVPFYESVGFEPYPESVPIPEGGEGELTQLLHSSDG